MTEKTIRATLSTPILWKEMTDMKVIFITVLLLILRLMPFMICMAKRKTNLLKLNIIQLLQKAGYGMMISGIAGTAVMRILPAREAYQVKYRKAV